MFNDNDILHDIPTKEVYTALCRFAESKGVRIYKDTLSGDSFNDYPSLVFLSDQICGCNSPKNDEYKTKITLEEFVQKCESYINLTIVFLTEKYDGVISKDHITVGCQHVSWEKFDELCVKANKFRNNK